MSRAVPASIGSPIQTRREHGAEQQRRRRSRRGTRAPGRARRRGTAAPARRPAGARQREVRGSGRRHGELSTVTSPLRAQRLDLVRGVVGDREPAHALGAGVALRVDAVAAGGTTARTSPLRERSSIRSAEQSAAALTSPDADVATSEKPQKPVMAIGPEPLATRAEPLRPLIPIRPLDVRTLTSTLSGTATRKLAWQLPSTVSGQFEVIRSTPLLTLRGSRADG